MEAWIIYTFIAVIFWTIVELIDKYVLDYEVKDPIIATIVCGVATFIVFQIAALRYGDFFGMSLKVIVIAIFAGILYNLSTWFYYIGMQKEDMSTFIPLLSIAPLFVLPLGFIFFGERFTLSTYSGIFLTIVGAILISYKKTRSKARLTSGLFFAIYIAIIYAVRAVVLKYITTLADIWALMFWIAVGGIIVSIIMYLSYRKKVQKTISKKGFSHLILSGILTAFGFFAGFFAVAKGSVTLVTALFNIQPMFAFIAVITIIKSYPKLIKERMSKHIMFKKFIAIVLMIIGTVLII